MDLSPRQQKAVFVLVVAVLAALGYWLILPKVTHSHGPAQAAVPPTPSAASSAPAPEGSPGTTPPPATASPAPTGSVNIYSWLPFTQQGLADAAAVTVKFGADYNTYSYTEDAAAYVGTMNGLITGQLATTLQGLYSTPGVAAQDQPETGVHRNGGDRLAADLRPVEPDVHRYRDAAPGQLARHHQRQRAICHHRHRLGHQLASE